MSADERLTSVNERLMSADERLMSADERLTSVDGPLIPGAGLPWPIADAEAPRGDGRAGIKSSPSEGGLKPALHARIPGPSGRASEAGGEARTRQSDGYAEILFRE
jgi:hypothetical protein